MSVFSSDLLRGKVCLVTGGGSGIGAAIASKLASQGATVALLGRTEEKLAAQKKRIEDAGGVAMVCPCDVRQYVELDAQVQKVVAAYGKLDIVVNSAAGNFLSPAATLSANGFRAVIDIDLCGTFNTCRAAFAALSVSGGAIVNVTATQASVPTPLQCHAGAAKAGIEKLTRDLALEWSRLGIRVNSIAPGPIAGTEGMARLAPPGAEETMQNRVPLGRWGTLEEIAECTLFLCSPAATFITGSTLLVDGGTSLLGGGAFMDMLVGSGG